MALLFGSSSSRHTYNHLRKRRKWPFSPYKAKWHETFNQQQAMQTLKQTPPAPPPQQNPSKPHLLSTLIDAFTIYGSNPTPSAYHFVIKTLTQTSQFNQLHPVLDRLEKVENFETPEYIFVDLIRTYGDANMLQPAVDLFFRIPNFRCVPSVYSLNSLLSILCKKREGLRIVPQILLKSQLMSIRIEESSFRILITALCRIKKPGFAINLFNYMIRDGYSFDLRICSLILSSLCEQRGVSTVDVMGFFEEIRKLGFDADMVDWCNVIRFLVKGGRGLDALGVMNLMKMDGIKPDIVCYTMVLNGVVSDGEYATADEVFDEMLVLGLVPDVYTYNVYINGLCKQDNVEAGFKMVACMEELGCKPNLITYNTILEGCCKVGELSKARGVVREMGLRGVRFNFRTYRIMIDGLARKGEIDEACGLLEELLDRGFVPQSTTADEIVCGLCQRGLACKALELLKIMVGKNVALGARAWEALFLGSESKLSFAETTLTDLVNPRLTHPDKLLKH